MGLNWIKFDDLSGCSKFLGEKNEKSMYEGSCYAILEVTILKQYLSPAEQRQLVVFQLNDIRNLKCKSDFQNSQIPTCWNQ